MSSQYKLRKKRSVAQCPDLMSKLLLLPINQRSRDRKNQIGTDDLSEKSL